MIYFQSVGLLAMILNEDPSIIYAKGSTPCLIVEEKSLYVDGKPFLTNIRPENALFHWAAMFNILNIAVPEKLVKTHQFIMSEIFCVCINKKKSQTLLKLKAMYNES